MMARNAFWFGISFAIVAKTVGFSILKESDFVAAIVVFNATDLTTNTSERLVSLGLPCQNGRYGASSPKQNIVGLVRLAREINGHHYGCSEPYQNVNTGKPWIALAERGDCQFSDKIRQARLANASGIITYNNEDGVITMTHTDEVEIVAVSILHDVGIRVVTEIKSGKVVTVEIARGSICESQYGHSNKTSIIFVSLSFLILMIISLTWLIVYYVQRFRLVHAPDILKKRRAQARKIVSSLPKRLLKDGDKELTSGEICPICIETYKAEETLRILPCKHNFHRKCVDPWLRVRETCPMCKLDIMKSQNLVSYDFIFGTRRPVVEEWEPTPSEAEPDSSNSRDLLVTRTDYHESVIVADVEGEDGPSQNVLNSVSSSDAESPLQSPNFCNSGSSPGDVAPA